VRVWKTIHSNNLNQSVTFEKKLLRCCAPYERLFVPVRGFTTIVEKALRKNCHISDHDEVVLARRWEEQIIME